MELGKQIATVDGVEIKYNADDVPYFVVGFRAADGERMAGYLYTSDKAIGIARKSMKAIGFDIDTRDLNELCDNPKLLDGNEAEIDVVEEEYKGKIRTKIAWINPVARKVSKEDLQRLTHALRNAKRANEDLDSQM
jgi:hypothetical protein